MSALLDALRVNKNGKYELPYSAGWREDTWMSYFLGSTEEAEEDVKEAGLACGRFCLRLWEEIEAAAAGYAVPLFFRSVVDAANAQFLLRSEEMAKRLKERVEDSRQALDPFDKEAGLIFEDISDALSDLFFSNHKAGRRVAHNLYLPDSINAIPNGLVSSAIFALQKISTFRFIFDRVLFVGGSFEADNGSLRVRSDTPEAVEFIKRRCISTATDTDHGMGLAKELENLSQEEVFTRSPYKVVCGVDVKDGQPLFHYSFVHEAREYSRITQLRWRVDSEYLFETLGRDRMDVVLAWDVMHSLVMTITKVGDQRLAHSLATSEFKRADVIQMVRECLGITPQRARLAVEALLLDRPCTDGIWSRPIVPVDREYVKIVLPSILSINPLRFVHLLVANAGLRDERGRNFENKAIDQIRGFSERNSASSGLRILTKDHPIYGLIGRKKKETDLIAVLGNIVVLADVKSVTHVAGPREWYHAKSSINKGFNQVRLRSDAIKLHSKQVKLMLGLENFEALGLVITNDRIFTGMTDGAAFVVDLASLISFIKGGAMHFGVSFADSKPDRSIPTFDDPTSFRAAFLKHIKAPLQMAARMAGLTRSVEKVDIGTCSVEFDRYVMDMQMMLDYINSVDENYYTSAGE